MGRRKPSPGYLPYPDGGAFNFFGPSGFGLAKHIILCKINGYLVVGLMPQSPTPKALSTVLKHKVNFSILDTYPVYPVILSND